MRAGAELARGLGRHLHVDRDPARFGRADLDLGPRRDRRLRQALHLDAVALRLLGRVHDLQPVDVLDAGRRRPSRASAPRSRTTSTLSGVRSARLATQRDARCASSTRAVDQHARAQHAAPRSARALQPLRQRVLRSRSGSGRAGSPSCPSRCRRRRCRRRSRCTRTAGPCGCRCRSGRPARRACSRCSRPGPARAGSALARARAARLAARARRR